MTIYERVRRLCNNHGISISNLGQYLPDVEVSKSAVSHWKNGSVPRTEVIKSIADYFGVTPEYIANGTTADALESRSASSVHPVAIIDGREKRLSEQEVAILHLCRDLDVIQKAKLLAYASEL